MDPQPSIGLVISRAPGDAAARALMGLAREAAEAGHEVMLYLLDEGVRYLDEPELDGLRDKGVKLYCCAMGAQKRGIEPSRKALFSGLYVLASLVAGCDRFLSA